ncbi:ABC-2 type transport system permease protein [Tenacibaculum mesophilum]|uniref:DUF3526 domain-containing protein n=1 Tax=Tenacibaculum mesophilum TaxID=104268 RepID=A0ABN5T7I4_9FLAO|nr:DUF3526 domain-containing protein [Tenacibaculum mesophilum]AZJ32400.1 DUF3526 domain-containing protein [Tenacibaculum mesophilum]QFS27653.1 DUF3526 domain-containing protein [Tenacibaculum mesophilum]SHG14277.1 ABC-2 type transport system permease protein [Tenacibaculum mesophilum]
MKTIICKELTELRRDGRFGFSIIIILILLLIAGITSYNQFKTINKQYSISKEKERSMWDTQGDKNPHSAAHYGTYAFKPKFALSLFDNGVNKYTGNSIFLEAHKRNEAAYSEASDQTELARFGTLSLNFVLLYLIPLLILLMGYNTFTKEKELDTLRLLKSQGVSPVRLALGKWFSIFIPVFILNTIVFLVVGIFLSSNSFTGLFSWNNLSLLYTSYLVYYMIIVTITILISSISKSSGISLVVNMSLWILFCFITPKIATNLANDFHPYPTKQQFQASIKQDKEKGLDGHNPWSKEAQILKEKTLKEYGVDSIQQLPFNYDAYRMQKGEEHEARVYKKHYGFLKEVFENQNTTYQKLAVISPFIPIRILSMDIANTGYIAHWNFTDAAESYRVSTQKFLNDDFKNNSKTGDWSYKTEADKFSKLPEFKYHTPNLSTIITWNFKNFFILFIWLLVPFYLLITFSKKL